MPCYSRIETQITDAARLRKALEATGHTIASATELRVHTAQGLSFVRQDVKEAFSAQGNGLEVVARKYAEIGVRTWASRNGYSVVEASDKRLELIKR